MTELTNGYFEMMRDIGIGYEAAKAKRMQEKEEILKRANNDELLKKWYDREKNYPFPFSRGQTTAYRAWQESREFNTEYFECSDIPWEKDIPDFVATLREAYIDKFVVTDRSTGLMEGLHNLEAAGCTMISLIKLSKSEKRWGGSETIISPGILFEIK